MEDRLHYLFKRYLENKCSRQELEEFFTYVEKADHDEQLRLHIKKVYKDLKGTESATTHVDESGRLILTRSESFDSSPAILLPNRSKLLTRISVAASIITIVAAVWITNGRTSNRDKNSTIASLTKKTSDRSEFKYLLLQDSTQVWLNAASSLEFPDEFNTTQREVFLSGEAYFDVKHADKIPFIIRTGDVSTTVLGTAFNIKAYPEHKNITISVSRGTVRITRKNGLLATLTRGQELRVKDNGREVKEKNVPVEGIAGWQQGNIVYDDETLEDIVADMQRVYNVDIRIDKQSIKDLGISTSFKKEIGIVQALQVLCNLTDAELKQNEGIYFIQ